MNINYVLKAISVTNCEKKLIEEFLYNKFGERSKNILNTLFKDDLICVEEGYLTLTPKGRKKVKQIRVMKSAG